LEKPPIYPKHALEDFAVREKIINAKVFGTCPKALL